MRAIFWEGLAEDNFIGHICAEIFKDKVYAPFLVGKKDLIILDVGAHIGLFSLYASKYAKKLYAIEPSLEHAQCLAMMVKHNGLDNIVPCKCAIANKDGEMTLYHNKNKTMFSLSPAINDKSSKPEIVDTIRLDTFFKQHKIDHVDFMKLDIEGKEDEVFGGDGFANVADKIDTIVYETHAWMNRNPAQIKVSLEGRGFKVNQIKAEAQLWVARR